VSGWEAPAGPPRRRWPAVVAVLVGAALVAAVATTIGAAPDDRLAVEAATATPTPTVTAPAALRAPVGATWPRPQPGLWRQLPPSPLGPRFGHALVATGRQLLVWGGSDRRGRPLTDGAVFDLGTGAWRRLPDNGARGSRVTGVWTGEDVVLVSPTETRRYDPDRLTWQTVARVPRPGGMVAGRRLRAAGAVVVTLLTAADGSGASAAFALAPRAARWRRLPDPPVALRRDDVLLADAERVLIAAPGRAGRPPAVVELALDDVAAGWNQATAPVGFTADRVGQLSGVLDRGRVLLWGTGTPADGGEPNTWAAVRQEEEAAAAWERIDPGPVRPSRLVDALATGDGALVWNGVDGRGALWRWGTDRWTRIFAPPLEDPSPRPVAWTGSGVAIWGGTTATGGVFTPR
jgi:hypothetical protein